MRNFLRIINGINNSTTTKIIPMRSNLRLANKYQRIMNLDIPKQLRLENTKSAVTSFVINPRVERPYLTAGGRHKPPIDITKADKANGIPSKKQLSDHEIQELMISMINHLDRNYQNRKHGKYYIKKI